MVATDFERLLQCPSIETYLSKHPRNRRFVRASDVFPKRGAMLQSDFYRKYMAPQKRPHGIGLFFWQRQRLLAIIVIMRTAEQGDFTPVQTKFFATSTRSFRRRCDDCNWSSANAPRGLRSKVF